jgi:hypothetical protein
MGISRGIGVGRARGCVQVAEVVPHGLERDFPAVLLRVLGEVLQVLAVMVRHGRQHGREYRVMPHDRGSELTRSTSSIRSAVLMSSRPSLWSPRSFPLPLRDCTGSGRSAPGHGLGGPHGNIQVRQAPCGSHHGPPERPFQAVSTIGTSTTFSHGCPTSLPVSTRSCTWRARFWRLRTADDLRMIEGDGLPCP